MTFDFGEQVLNYFQERNQSHLTIDLEELSSPCCVGRLPEIRFRDGIPENTELYRRFVVHGIHIYLSRLLRTQEALRLTLSGFGPFKRLELGGVNLIL
ncbi:MAG: hypothetical protein COV67_10425 [Nitrospinae bacterium CG11_big_fil_rev_8_21_14_0_20_56_8]|nr:MAG: hypothetical protein COV67_10425 [Nitrospinae bacterium CG11_big_fil_rev_8_21_14_0_20_56_8]